MILPKLDPLHIPYSNMDPLSGALKSALFDHTQHCSMDKLPNGIKNEIKEYIQNSNGDISMRKLREHLEDKFEMNLVNFMAEVKKITLEAIEALEALEEESDEDDIIPRKRKSGDDGGMEKKRAKKDHIMLGPKLKVSLSTFRGQSKVDIREFYLDKNAELKPTKKGVRLDATQWNLLKENFNLIDSWFN